LNAAGINYNTLKAGDALKRLQRVMAKERSEKYPHQTLSVT
jgi:hypothetical protein